MEIANKAEQKLAKRSIDFLKKLYPVVQDAGYDINITDELRDAVAKIACSDTKLLKQEYIAGKMLFDVYADDEIISAIEPAVYRNIAFVNSENNVEKYIKLMNAELEYRRSDVEWLLNSSSEYLNEKVMSYHIDIIKYCPNTTMLMLLLTFDKMKREGIL